MLHNPAILINSEFEWVQNEGRQNMGKRILAALLASVMVVALLGGCSQQAAQQSSGSTAASSEGVDRVKQLVDSMTTEQKLAQMMIVSLRSDAQNTKLPTELTEDYVNLLKKYDFGGIILYQGNIVDPKQTVTFIRDAQTAAMNSEQKIPMLVAVDQEGGMVSRVPFGPVGSGNMALQATGDSTLIEKSATMLGKSIATLGFNMNFAPVCDVNNNANNSIIGSRSFSDDPNVVAQDVTVFAKAIQNAGVCTALKHFPGHGNVDTDSHIGLPSTNISLDELKKCELIPFEAGIKAGTDMIMTAHIQFPNIEKETYASKKDGSNITLPATLSHTVLTGILREQLGYEGIIITDDMCMGAIADHFDRTDAAVLAINAGADIILGPMFVYKDSETDTFSDVDAYFEALVARVEAGDISKERLDESVTRILTLKANKGIMDKTLAQSADEQIKAAEAFASDTKNLDEDWSITQKAVTLLKNDDKTLPFDGNDGKRTLVLYPTDLRQPTVEYVAKRLQGEKLLADGSMTSLCYADLKADDAQLQEKLAQADRVLLLSQTPTRNEEMAKVIEQAQKGGKKVALLSLGVPYDAACYPEANAVLCAYQYSGTAHDAEGNGPFNMNVAVAMGDVFGESVPQGTLPVNVPIFANGTFSVGNNLYERGFGLKDWGV